MTVAAITIPSMISVKMGSELSNSEVPALRTLWEPHFPFDYSVDVDNAPLGDDTEAMMLLRNRIQYANDVFLLITKESFDSANSNLNSNNNGDQEAAANPIILATARLRPLNGFTFNGKVFTNNNETPLYGLADVVTHPELARGRGLGKVICEGIKAYSQLFGATILGFTTRDNTGFYRKMGFESMDGAFTTNSWIYQTPNEDLYFSDVVYLRGKSGLVEEILQNPQVPVVIPRKHW